MVDPRKLLQQRKAQFLRQAEEQYDRDMQAITELTAKYGLEIAPADGATSEPPKAVNAASKPPRVVGGSLQGAVVKGTADLLRRRGVRMQSGDIAKTLITQGVQLNKDSAGKRVSAYLARSALFDNNMEFGGYGLAEWNGAKSAPQATSNAKEK